MSASTKRCPLSEFTDSRSRCLEADCAWWLKVRWGFNEDRTPRFLEGCAIAIQAEAAHRQNAALTNISRVLERQEVNKQ